MGIPHFFVSTWKGNNHFTSYIAGIRALKARLTHDPVDICHSHFQLGTIAAILLKTMGITRHVLRTCHITNEWEAGFYGWIREQIISKWVFPLCLDVEVGVSQAIVDRLNSYPGTRLTHRKAIVIHNAIASELFHASNEMLKNRKSRETSVIGVLGRLTKQKGHRYLIDAIPNIVQAFSNLEFWIIGEGELHRELEDRATRLGIDSYVKFLGRRNDIPALFQKMDLMVLPSLWEGLPTVVLESFVYGVPVVATDISGTRELVIQGETGWLVPPADPAGLANGILTALNDESGRNRIREAARKKVENFSIERVAENYKSLYEMLFAG